MYFSQDRSASRDHCSFDESSLHRTVRWGPYLKLYQPGSHCSPFSGETLRPCPIHLLSPPKLFPIDFPYGWSVLSHVSNFPKISQVSSIWPQCAPYLLLGGPRPGTSSSWPWFAAWPHLVTSKPSTSSHYLHKVL